MHGTYRLKVKKYVSNEPGAVNRDSKTMAIMELKRNIVFTTSFQRMWFAVLRRAILDIGARHNVIKHPHNSDRFFRNGGDGFEYICECIGTYKSYVLKILKKHKVWPLPDDYYDRERYNNESKEIQTDQGPTP